MEKKHLLFIGAILAISSIISMTGAQFSEVSEAAASCGCSTYKVCRMSGQVVDYGYKYVQYCGAGCDSCCQNYCDYVVGDESCWCRIGRACN